MEKENGKTIQIDRGILALAAFAILAIVVMIAMVWKLEIECVPACLILLLEVALAVVLHHVELWKHGVLVIAQLIAGVVIEKLLLVVLCILIYVTATAVLLVLKKGKD